jgi:hypothetical protein
LWLEGNSFYPNLGYSFGPTRHIPGMDIQRYPDESLDWLAAGGKMQETMGFTKYIGISCKLSCKIL